MKFSIIYADCPWKFGSKQLQKYGGTRFHNLSEQYTVMSTEDICHLPVSTITDEDCALFLWVTDAHIPDGLRVISSWGFKYSTVAFVWRKMTTNGLVAATLGTWTMKNCELCLFAIKGRMLQYKKTNNVYQWLDAERLGHSQKPQEVRDRIDLLFGELPRVELFAREQQDGWITIGNEITGNSIEVDIDLLSKDIIPLGKEIY